MRRVSPTAVIRAHTNLWGSYEIGHGVRIGCFCDIGGCKIGNNTSIQAFVFIPPGTVVGDGVFLGPRVTILNDKYPPSDEVSGVTIEDDAVIGGGVTICPGVRIGAGAKIAAGALVTKDVPAGEVWGGQPARKIESEGWQ